jgi:[ribosomal protein S18]-alanine N-acetyltransferase
VGFSVRKYRQEDFDTLWRIDQSCFTRGIAYTRFELTTFVNRRESFTLVAEAEQSAAGGGADQSSEDVEILGFIVAERSRSAGHIITIDVRAEARRHHVGSVLLGSAEEQLKAWDCSIMRLETAVDNVGALSFYKRHGYGVVKTIPRYYSNGVDALLLEKNLLSPASPANLLR